MRIFRYKRHQTFSITAIVVFILAVAVSGVVIKVQAAGNLELVSVATDGSQAEGLSRYSLLSGDGRYVVFVSNASNLVPDDTNGVNDIFVRDRQTGTTERVSVASDGSEGNDLSGFSDPHELSITPDGRYVAFMSAASNLVPDDTNGNQQSATWGWDIFVHDRQTGTTERINIASDGSEAIGGGSFRLDISIDGRYVSFQSEASNLVPDDTNDVSDIFVHDRQTGTTERMSVTSEGTQGNGPSDHPSISFDGRYIAFMSVASDLVPSDTNALADIFVHDRQTGTTERINVSSDGSEGNNVAGGPTSMSADGRYISYITSASNLIPGATNPGNDVVVYDQQTDTNELVSIASDGSQANNNAATSSMSDDGRYVSFQSTATNLSPDASNGEMNIFVHDRETGETKIVTSAIGGSHGTRRFNFSPSISDDGQYVTFSSDVASLVANDTNNSWDVFVDENPFLITNQEPITTTFNSSADTYVKNGTANRNTGAGVFMRLQSSGDNRSLVLFDQTALQSTIGSGQVLSAKLRLTIVDNGNNWGTTGRTIDVHRLLVNWAEGNGTENNRGTGLGATWECASDSNIANLLKNCIGSTEWEMGQPNNSNIHPWTQITSATQTITNNQSGVVEFDVTSDVANFLNSTNPNYGWIIKKTEEGQNGQVSFGTKESSSVPQLVITYQP